MLASGGDINRVRQKLALVTGNGCETADFDFFSAVPMVILRDSGVFADGQTGLTTLLMDKMLLRSGRKSGDPIVSLGGRVISQFNGVEMNRNREMINPGFFVHAQTFGIDPRQADPGG